MLKEQRTKPEDYRCLGPLPECIEKVAQVFKGYTLYPTDWAVGFVAEESSFIREIQIVDCAWFEKEKYEGTRIQALVEMNRHVLYPEEKFKYWLIHWIPGVNKRLAQPLDETKVMLASKQAAKRLEKMKTALADPNWGSAPVASHPRVSKNVASRSVAQRRNRAGRLRMFARSARSTKQAAALRAQAKREEPGKYEEYPEAAREELLRLESVVGQLKGERKRLQKLHNKMYAGDGGRPLRQANHEAWKASRLAVKTAETGYKAGKQLLEQTDTKYRQELKLRPRRS